MPYLGNNLQVAYPTYRVIDDVSGSFNGVTTSFALLVGGLAPVPLPLNSQQCLISVGGVVQKPDDSGAEGFRLSGGNIVFSSAPNTGEDFFGVVLAGADYVNAGGAFPDGSVSVPSITFDSDTDTGFYRPSSGTVAITSNSTERVRIDSNGRVGIGTTSPTYKLQVVGTTGVQRVESSGATFGTPALNIYDSAHTVDISLTGINGTGTFGTYSNHPLAFYTQAAERMRIDSVGRVSIPYQPGFLASGSKSITSGGWVLVSDGFTTVSYNTGSHYNTTNGRFTAPIAGKYAFFAGGYSATAGTGERYGINARINGGAQTYITGGNYSTTDTPLGSYYVVYSLNANDYVDLTMFCALTTTIGIGAHTAFFGGHFLG